MQQIQSKAREEEVIVESWFWAEEETSLEAGASFESKHGAEKEEIIVGSWFWAEESIDIRPQAVEETTSRSGEETILNPGSGMQRSQCKPKHAVRLSQRMIKR